MAGRARNSDGPRQIVTRKDVNAQEPDRGDGVHRNSYPHAIHGGKLHGYVKVLNPERGSLKRDSNDLPNAVRLGIHPNVAKQQSLFLAFGNKCAARTPGPLQSLARAGRRSHNWIG